MSDAVLMTARLTQAQARALRFLTNPGVRGDLTYEHEAHTAGFSIVPFVTLDRLGLVKLRRHLDNGRMWDVRLTVEGARWVREHEGDVTWVRSKEGG